MSGGKFRYIRKFVCHSKRVIELAKSYGWQSGARYTNLRDVRGQARVGFLDIDWKEYSYPQHLSAARAVLPKVTVAQDVIDISDLGRILEQAEELNQYADEVIVVPKDKRLGESLTQLVPDQYLLGYSVPTKYGGTELELDAFDRRPVHLLGGRPDVQRSLADKLNVVSLDTNRFTLDAAFGDYFDGQTFRPHPVGGYENCLKDSLRNINALWTTYDGPQSGIGMHA